MLDRVELKQYAKGQLAEIWPKALLLVVFSFLLHFLWRGFTGEGEQAGWLWSWQLIWHWNFSSFLFYWLGQAVIGLLTVGYDWCFQDAARQGSFSFRTMLDPFASFLKTIGLFILIYLATTLGFLLFVVPGILVTLGFSQCFFVLREHPQWSVGRILSQSWQLMVGHKLEYFVLCLSFLGWWLLGGLTWGLAYLYVYPYFYTTRGAYYDYLVSRAI